MEFSEAETLSSDTINTSMEVLQSADFSQPVKTFFANLSDPSLSAQSPQMQQAHLVGSAGELLKDVQNIQHLLATWRTAVQEMPGIQRSAGQQMYRLQNLNKALERRAKLLERHQTLLNSARLVNNGTQGE